MDSALQRHLLSMGMEPRALPTQEQIRDLEKTVNAKLPVAYVEFLSEFGATLNNGAVNCGTVDSMPLYVGPDDVAQPFHVVRVGAFYPLFPVATGPKQTVAGVLQAYTDRMPDGFLPFCTESSGNELCLAIRGPHAGQVFYWDIDNEWDADEFLEQFGYSIPDENKYQNVYLLADSFEEFLWKLEVDLSLL